MEELHVTEDLTSLKKKKCFLAFLIPGREDLTGEISCGGGWRGGKVNTKRMKCCPIAHSWTLHTKEGWQALGEINYIPEICGKPQGTTETLFDIMFCMEGEELSNEAKDIIHLDYGKCFQQKVGKAATHGGTSTMVKKEAHLELTSVSQPLSWMWHSYLDFPEQKLVLKCRLLSYR